MDQQLERLINTAWTHPALDRLMAVMSSLDLWLPFLAVAFVFVACRGGAKGRWFLATLALTLAISDGVVSESLKHLAHRPRPFQQQAGIRQVDLARHARPRLWALFQPLEIRFSAPTPEGVAAAERSEGRSFPSSHTMNNFCAATVLALFYRRWGWLYFIPAAMVGYSRIYVGVHWPSDVLASALLAAPLACAIVALCDLARRALAPCEPAPRPLVL